MSVTQWDFFFLPACVFGLSALHRLPLVREQGEVGEKVVVDEFLGHARRGMRNLSTIAGLRAMTEFPPGWFRSNRGRSRKDSRDATI